MPILFPKHCSATFQAAKNQICVRGCIREESTLWQRDRSRDIQDRFWPVYHNRTPENQTTRVFHLNIEHNRITLPLLPCQLKREGSDTLNLRHRARNRVAPSRTSFCHIPVWGRIPRGGRIVAVGPEIDHSGAQFNWIMKTLLNSILLTSLLTFAVLWDTL